MYILIGFLLLFILAIVAAYFGSRVWHWAHVLLVVAIFLSAVGFLILASETLRIIAHYRQESNTFEQQLERVNTDIAALRNGTDEGGVIGGLAADEVQVPEDAEEMPGIRDLDHELHLATRVRGRAWRNVAPVGFDPQTLTVQAGISAPQPSGIDRDSILFLFEQGPPSLPDPTRGPQYLGEFRVTGVDGQQITMTSVNLMDEFQQQRLAAGRGPWTLYETMPVDSYDLFTGMTEDELRKLLPERSVQEYIRQGTPAGPDDDEWHRVGIDEQGNLLGPADMDKAAKVLYQRRLRDYNVEFDALARRRVLLLSNIAAVTKDNERLQTALASAQKLQAFRQEELRKLGMDLAGVQKEREIIEKHLAAVQTQLKNAQQLLNDSLAANTRLVQELADLQRAWQTFDSGQSQAPSEGPLALSAPSG